MAGDQSAVVFDTAVPFDGGSCQVANHTDQGANAADYGVFQHLTMGGSSVNDAQACRAEDAANGSFDGFFRTQDRSHFVFTDQHADAVCAGIAAPGAQKDEPHHKLPVRKVPGQIDEREHHGHVDDAEIRRHHLVCGEFRIAEYIHEHEQNDGQDHGHHPVTVKVHIHEAVIQYGSEVSHDLQKIKVFLSYSHRLVQFLHADNGNPHQGKQKYVASCHDG